jgi:hypothetical protein
MTSTGSKGAKKHAQICTDVPTYRRGREFVESVRLYLSWRSNHAVCDRVSRQESGKAFVSASIQRRAIPRPSGKRRSVHSGNGLPRYSLVPCQWLFSADERQSRESYANFAKTRIHSWMDYKPLSIFCDHSGEPKTAFAGPLARTCAQFPFNRNTPGLALVHSQSFHRTMLYSRPCSWKSTISL